MTQNILSSFLKGTSLFTVATLLLAVSSSVRAQNAESISLKFDAPQTPILICANGEARATQLQAFDVDVMPDSVLLTVSEPKYIARFEARFADVIVGSFDANGMFDVDWNRPTMPTQIPIPIKGKSLFESGGELSIWAVPSELAGPETTVEVGVKWVKIGDQTLPCSAAPLEYRFGVLVRDSGWDEKAPKSFLDNLLTIRKAPGDGTVQYRIPALAQTPKGVLLAVYDARWNGLRDLPADIDVMCSRSLDGGKTWEKMRPVMDFKGDDPVKEGVGDPSILVDPETGRVWVAAVWGHCGQGCWTSQPGLKVGTSPRFVLCYSDDDGLTWSEPRDITNETAPGKDWRHFYQGPGNGIVLRDGKLVFPAQFADAEGIWYSTLIWSDDKGETWHVGTGAHRMTCESQLVELNDGSIMMNMRHFTDKTRAVATTKDLGETWTEHPTSGKTLIEPVCQASLIRVKSTVDGDDADLLAFMNPKSQTNRVDMTLRLSDDEGATWSRELTLYRPQCAGYSALTKIDDETLGVLYETLGGLIFQRVKLSDIPEVK